jgi:D-lactate dehydrogenase
VSPGTKARELWPTTPILAKTGPILAIVAHPNARSSCDHRSVIKSRGRLIHTAALIKALKSGHVGGVALDVYEEEEGIFFEDLSGEILQDDELARLLTFPNVLVTAHQAFLTHEALSEIARITVENVWRFVSKQDLLEGTVL